MKKSTVVDGKTGKSTDSRCAVLLSSLLAFLFRFAEEAPFCTLSIEFNLGTVGICFRMQGTYEFWNVSEKRT